MCVLVYDIFILQYKFDKIYRLIYKKKHLHREITNEGLEVKCDKGSPRIVVLIFNFEKFWKTDTMDRVYSVFLIGYVNCAEFS